jgi:alcohol dehydrogenase class IV
MAPVIAIPTTAGTGSEVGRASLMNLSDGRKVGIVGAQMIPKRAICDPELTLGMPPRLTAATGMDALSHCIETFLSPRFNPPADAIALDGAGRIIRNLERAVTDGQDLAAREELMMGALMGGMCFQKGLGAVHGLSHALGSLKEPSLHHGTLNAVLLPPVLRFNAGHAGDKYEPDSWRSKPIQLSAARFLQARRASSSGAGPGRQGRGVPAPGRRLRRELRRALRRQHPRLLPRLPADGGGADLRRAPARW